MSDQGTKSSGRVEKAADVPPAVQGAYPDPVAVAALFTEDATFVVGDGTILDGREEIGAYFKKGLEGDQSYSLKGVRAVANFDRERQVGPDAFVVRTKGGLVNPGETDVHPERTGVQTWVIVRQNGTWLAAAYQNTRIAHN